MRPAPPPDIFAHHHEGWDSYGYVGGVTWASKITKPLPDLQRVVQEVTERKRAAEMQDEYQKFLTSGIGFFGLDRHGLEARTATDSQTFSGLWRPARRSCCFGGPGARERRS